MTRNSAIHLDFVRSGGPLARMGSLLLVLGAVAAGATVLLERHAADERAAREAEVEQLRSISHRSMSALEAREADSPAMREQIKRANEVLAQMNVPWGELFAAIESAQDPAIALLALVPDARTRSVQINGQARDLAAVLAYMRRLQGTRLKEVVLATHEAKVKEPGAPVEFSMLARWMEQR